MGWKGNDWGYVDYIPPPDLAEMRRTPPAMVLLPVESTGHQFNGMCFTGNSMI